MIDGYSEFMNQHWFAGLVIAAVILFGIIVWWVKR